MLADIVDAIKCLTRPLLVLGVALAWILFIKWGTEVPDAFTGIAAAVIAEWALERGYRGYKEWQRRG